RAGASMFFNRDFPTQFSTTAWEHSANKDRVSCAKHVTWTSRYWMIRGRKVLISLGLLRTAPRLGNSVIWRMKKPANALALRAFYLVAGVGFEPTTFRL